MAEKSRTDNWIAAINLGLKLVGLVLLLIVVWPLRGPLTEKLSTNLGEVEAFGVRFTFVADQIEDTFAKAAAADPERWGDPAVTVPSIRNRVEMLGSVVPGARVLWVDEGHPLSNLYERRILQAIGMHVDMAQTGAQATELMRRSCYDVVISEMKHGDDATAGATLAAQLNDMPDAPPVILYILQLDRSRGTPAYAHGITNRPAELVHMTLDVLERRLAERCAGRGDV